MAAMSSPLRILAVPVIPRSPAIFCSSGSSLPDKPVPRRFEAGLPPAPDASVAVAVTPSEVLLLSLTKGPSLERDAAVVWSASLKSDRHGSACPPAQRRDVLVDRSANRGCGCTFAQFAHARLEGRGICDRPHRA